MVGATNVNSRENKSAPRLLRSAPPLHAAYLRMGWGTPAFYVCCLKLAHYFTHQLLKLFNRRGLGVQGPDANELGVCCSENRVL